MRYLYVLIVMTAMAFVAAGSARGQGSKNNDKPNPPSTSCPEALQLGQFKGSMCAAAVPEALRLGQFKGSMCAANLQDGL